MVLRWLDIHMQKNNFVSLSSYPAQNWLNMDHRPQLRAKTIKLLEYRDKSSWPWIRQSHFRYSTKSTSDNKKINKLNFTKIKNFYIWKDLWRNDNLKDKRKYLQTICLINNVHLEYIKNCNNSTIKVRWSNFLNEQRSWKDFFPKIQK